MIAHVETHFFKVKVEFLRLVNQIFFPHSNNRNCNIIMSANLVSCMLIDFGKEASIFTNVPHHVFLFLHLLRWLSEGNIVNLILPIL